VRPDELLQTIPKNYRPWLHLATTAGSGLIVLGIACGFIEHLTAWELLTIPAVFVLANAAEWRAHKHLLHRRTFPFHILYDRHTPQHHVLYTFDRMAIESYRELKLVLVPAFGVAAIVLAIAPPALLLGWLVSENAAWLVVATGALYVVFYEVAHLSYHLPASHPVSRWSLVRKLREQHRRHHDPRLMQRFNFNVTVPLWDWVRGTLISESQFVKITGEKQLPRGSA